MGYIIGALGSILLWKVDRQLYFGKINKAVRRLLKNKILSYLFYTLLMAILIYLFLSIKNRELSNLLTAFIVIDISNTERENLLKKDKIHFYDSISTISRALVCGFVAPLFYILCFGNIFAILYMFIYNINLCAQNEQITKSFFYFFSILPCLITEIPLYIIYVFRNKKLVVKYKGDFFINFILRPILNVDILASNVERVNFYYYYSNKEADYLKGYGDYNNKIDEISIKDYLGISYSICIVIFVTFFILMYIVGVK